MRRQKTVNRANQCWLHSMGQWLAMLCIMLLIAGCSDGVCVDADDWGQNKKANVAVPSIDEITDSGVQLEAGQPLYMKATGTIDLCPTRLVLDENSSPRISPQVSVWQNTGILVNKGDYYSIYVHSAENKNESTPNSSAYMDRRGELITKGEGLYVMIVPSDDQEGLKKDQDNNTANDSRNGKYFWPGNQTVSDDGSGTTFYELWENDPKKGKGPGSKIGGFSGLATDTGVIWVRYARTAKKGDGSRNFSDSGDWESRWSPWRGRYAWGENECRYVCNPGVIASVCAAAGPFAGVCITSAMTACGVKKQLPDQANCKWNPHWVDEDYRDNSNGYEIEITAGCPGENGTFLQALIAGESDIIAQQEPVFQPLGCLPGSDGCIPAVDKNGRPLTSPVYQLTSNAKATILEMDPAQGAQLDKDGAYNGVVPRTGRLWFRIKDRQTKASDAIATPANCDVATDKEHYLSPPNEPIGCVQHVHPEVNPNQKECYRDYITKGNSRVRDPAICGKSTLEKLTCQLAQSGSDSKTYIDQCGVLNPECKPPMGFTGYSDNLGSYKVFVKTTKPNNGFSSMADHLIKPVRAILFGTCRANSSLNEVDCNNLPRVSTVVPTPANLNGEESAIQCGTTPSSGSGTNTTVQANVLPDQVDIGYEVTDSSNNSMWQPGIVKRMYSKLIGSSDNGANPFVNAVRAALLLYIILHAFRYMFGLIEDPQKDFAATVIRIGLLQQMLSPSSWEFFNTYFFTLFINGINELIAIFAGQFTGLGQEVLIDPLTGQVVTDATGTAVSINSMSPFAFVDQTLDRFFSGETWIKILALLFSSPLGLLYLVFIVIGMFYFIQAVLVAIILYLLALIAIGLQIALAPIFIAFMLFKKTRGFFENWVNYLVSHMLQPVFVLTALSMFNVFIYSAIYTLLHYTVCPECLFGFHADFKLFKMDVCFLEYYAPVGGSSVENVPIQFFVLLIFIILCQAMFAFNAWMSRLASELITSQTASTLATSAQKGFNSLKGPAMQALTMAKNAAAGGIQSVSRKGGEEKK